MILTTNIDWNSENMNIVNMALQDPDKSKNIMHLHTNKICITYLSQYDGYQIDFIHDLGRRLNLEIPPIFTIINNNTSLYSFFVHADWKNELLYLLSESCKNIEHSNGAFDSKLIETLKIVFRIFGGREPINLMEQKGIIGEILTICHLYHQFGLDLIRNWSRDSLFDFDLEQEKNYTIEAKCISKAQNALITVSHYNQLEWKDQDPISLLAVVRCTASKIPSEYMRLPEFIDSMIEKITAIDQSEGEIFREAINSQLTVSIFSDDIRKRFVTRFDFEDFIHLYEIISDDSADQMAKQTGVPDGVAIDSYRLNPIVLLPFKF